MTNKRWLLYLIIVAAIALLIATILRALTPTAPTVPETPLTTINIDGTQTEFSNMIFSGPSITTPPELTIAQVQVANSAEEDRITSRVISDYSLTPHQTLSILWTSSSYALSKSPTKSGNALYTLSTLSEQPPTTIINVDQARAYAQELANLYFGDSSLTVIESDTTYLTSDGSHLEETPTPSQATLVSFSFAHAIDDLPVLLEKNNTYPVQIMVNSDYQIQKMTFIPEAFSFTPAGKETVIDLNAAINNINADKASIIFLFNETAPRYDRSNIISGDLTSVQLEYRIDKTSNLAYPFYHFTGTVINAEGLSADADIITPAVATAPLPK